MFSNNCRNSSVELLPNGIYDISDLVETKSSVYEIEKNEDAFFIGDLGDIISKYKTWCQLLPRVEPFYAVKCNPDETVLQLLADLGTSFDCASKDEIQKVLNLGIPPSRIVYANPCKQRSFIRYAARQKVAMMTFDNEPELDKIKIAYPDAQLILRILPPSTFKVQCDLGIKFGCHPKKALDLYEKARSLDLNIVGVSFHVGSGVEEAEAFAAAVSEAYTVFQLGVDLGFDMSILDVGGGFPGQKSATVSFEEVAVVLNEALDRYFPPESGVRLIAEPGRYFVASAFTVTTNIISKRLISRDKLDEDGNKEQCISGNDEPAYMYYLNDGVYGSFNCLLYDHSVVTPSLLKESISDIRFSSSVWGPTCDGMDLILEDYMLPELHIGDWMYFKDMGAYTMCASSTFNGMPKPKCFFYCQHDKWLDIYPEAECSEKLTKNIVPCMKTGHVVENVQIYPDHRLEVFSSCA